MKNKMPRTRSYIMINAGRNIKMENNNKSERCYNINFINLITILTVLISFKK